MSPVFDLATDEGRTDGIAAAVEAARLGQCVVLPTDTVYGIGTDAFSASGVDALLAAKGRGREMPPPVLISDVAAVDGLATSVPSYARRLMDAFWPGGLTLIFRSQPSLAWDLGDTNGTVALRIPDDEFALDLLAEVGPMAVSSANRTGQPTITTITEAGFAFGPAVEVYLDAGTREGGTPSTILDCTKADPVMLREGAISAEQLREVLGTVELIDPEGEWRRQQTEEQAEMTTDHFVDPSTGQPIPADVTDVDPADGSQPIDLGKVTTADQAEPAPRSATSVAEPASAQPRPERDVDPSGPAPANEPSPDRIPDQGTDPTTR